MDYVYPYTVDPMHPEGMAYPYLSCTVQLATQSWLSDRRTINCALVDTGATRSAFSDYLLRSVFGGVRARYLSFRVADGTRRLFSTYYVNVSVAGFDCRYLEVFGVPRPEQFALLGRDILDRLCITFDGPRAKLYIGAA